MSLLIPFMAFVSVSIPIQEAIELTRARHAAIDKLRIEVSAYAYHAPDAENWQDESSWIALTAPSYQAAHTITIVRPAALYERLLHDPGSAAYPIRIFLNATGFTTEYPTPDEEGFTHYAITRKDADVPIPMPGPLSYTPVLWMFDVQFPDQSPLLLNTLAVLEQPNVIATLLENGLTRFSAEISSGSVPLHCSVDLNTRGTPVHGVVQLLFPGVAPATLEMFVDSTVEVDGFELPLTARTVIRNPNLASPFNAMACIWRQQVLCFDKTPDLERCDVEITPPQRNTVVATRVYSDAVTAEAVWYDEAGNAVRHASHVFAGAGGTASGSDTALQFASTGGGAPLRYVAGSISLLAVGAVLVRFVTQRSTR